MSAPPRPGALSSGREFLLSAFGQNVYSFTMEASPETGRSKRKREAKAAFERRAIREALEARIRKVLSTPPGERTPEGLALLDEHAAVVAPLMANMERSLRRKAQTEERLEEREDPPEVMMEHVAVLVELIRQRGTFVMHTGAGFSTAAAIPDFRGRDGIWTQQAKGRAVPMPRFENTKPTKAHLAAVALHDAGYLTHVVTQNVDGLHQRAGMPQHAVSELHGSVFRETCRNEACPMGPTPRDRTYRRVFDVTSASPTTAAQAQDRPPLRLRRRGLTSSPSWRTWATRRLKPPSPRRGVAPRPRVRDVAQGTPREHAAQTKRRARRL